MIGETVDDCSVEWSEDGLRKTLKSVAVTHVAKNTIEFTRPRSGAVVRKKLNAKHISITSSDGMDIVAAWVEETAEQRASREARAAALPRRRRRWGPFDHV